LKSTKVAAVFSSMNIAITSMYLPSGSKIGVGYVVHYLSNELVKRGHQVTVFSQTGHSEGALYDTVAVPSGKHLRSFGFAWNLRKYDWTRFDVLNAHGDDWFLWGCKRPRHVHTFHGSLWAEMLNATTPTIKLRMFALALCEYESCFLGDANTTVSSVTKRYIPNIQYVIPNGVNLQDFSPTEDKAENPTILFVGTMHGRKRGQMLLDIFQREIRPRVPNAEFWAVCENPLEEKDGVRWFGRVPYETLTDLYRRAWVFCLPSSYEGFGVPYIEAMASGTPVIAYPNDGAVEVTDHGRYGILSQDEDLADNLVSLLTDENRRHYFREAGLQRAQDFGWDRVCAQYEAVYRGDSPF
jgi:phosphatidylinositol alpha-mannosyltransferase